VAPQSSRALAPPSHSSHILREPSDIDAARQFVTEQWNIPADAVARGFERIEDALVQTGLDRWS